MTWLASPGDRGRRWPTPQDFNEAVQNPRSSFADHDLRRGAADRNKLGIPIAVTGNFAAVYRVRTGKDVHAVRCFLRNVSDQQARYELISRHVSSVKLPQAVEFVFLDEGIRVGGVWHPILKMDWIPGVTLAEYVGRNVDDRRVLNRLIERFLELLDDLRSRQIAHGDLQHGNLLVLEGRMGPSLKLIDYDGMWVPALDGRESNEIGHANYQHPDRTRAQYGQTLDSFSAWVILVSLLGLRWDPALWTTFRPQGADDRILLGKGDYLDVRASAGLRRLSQAGDAAVKHVAGCLIDLCPPRAQVLGLAPPTEEDVRGGRAVSWLPGALGGKAGGRSKRSEIPGGPARPPWLAPAPAAAEIALAPAPVAAEPPGAPVAVAPPLAAPSPAPAPAISAPTPAPAVSVPPAHAPAPLPPREPTPAHNTRAVPRRPPDWDTEEHPVARKLSGALLVVLVIVAALTGLGLLLPGEGSVTDAVSAQLGSPGGAVLLAILAILAIVINMRSSR